MDLKVCDICLVHGELDDTITVNHKEYLICRNCLLQIREFIYELELRRGARGET